MPCDPRMSEWGNPARLRRAMHCKCRRTRGTETSKYPQEKKIIMIPSVAASEGGAAQTAGVSAPSG